MYREGQLTYYKQPVINCNLERYWQETIQMSDYYQREKAVAVFNQKNRWVKRGICLIPVKYGIAFTGTFLMQVLGIALILSKTSIITHCMMCLIGSSFGQCVQWWVSAPASWRNWDGAGHPDKDATGGSTDARHFHGSHSQCGDKHCRRPQHNPNGCQRGFWPLRHGCLCEHSPMAIMLCEITVVSHWII